MNEEILNIQIRKFLKKVGVQSQREIEQAVRRSIENNSLAGIDKLEASVLLEVPPNSFVHTSLGVRRAHG